MRLWPAALALAAWLGPAPRLHADDPHQDAKPERYPYRSPSFVQERRLCEHGDARECLRAAGGFDWAPHYDNAPLTEAQQKDRWDLFDRACQLGAQEGCVRQAVLLKVKGVDLERARSLAEHACELREPHGCMVLADLVTDGAQIRKLYRRACELGYFGAKGRLYSANPRYESHCFGSSLGKPIRSR
jgi:hypothetical protein